MKPTETSMLFASRGLYNLWAPNAEFQVIYCIQIIQLLLSSIFSLSTYNIPIYYCVTYEFNHHKK